jgi:hypothetical protein
VLEQHLADDMTVVDMELVFLLSETFQLYLAGAAEEVGYTEYDLTILL